MTNICVVILLQVQANDFLRLAYFVFALDVEHALFSVMRGACTVSLSERNSTL